MRFEFHEESGGEVMATPPDLFDYLDDPRNLARHMESRSAMMAGMRMSIETDNLNGKAAATRGRWQADGTRVGAHLCAVVLQADGAGRNAGVLRRAASAAVHRGLTLPGHADAIVVGTHGRRGLGRVLLGSGGRAGHSICAGTGTGHPGR